MSAISDCFAYAFSGYIVSKIGLKKVLMGSFLLGAGGMGILVISQP